MKSRRRTVGALVLVGMLAAVGFYATTPSTPAFAQNRVQSDLIVRVYFDDLRTARSVATWIEPMESNYDAGFLVLEVNHEQYGRLLDAGLEVEIDDARTHRLAVDLPPAPLTGPVPATIPSFPCYRTVEETFATAQSLVANYPTLATWTDVGDSWEKTEGLGGYDENVLVLTNSAIPGPKTKIFMTSAIHAREYTTAELVTRLAEKLVTEYGVDADATWLIDHNEIHLMLIANPDGRKHAETGILWRKNTNQNYCSPTSNNRGADLNRNFQFQWNCWINISNSTCGECL